uniref:MORN repeat protein n=1 Tax=viral metagenome TaxID=1070528 RepID=A0A6C0I7H9_9ZZZZ
MNTTNMNYCEMEEKKREERRKIASCYASSVASCYASCDAGLEEEPLENDCNTWYSIEDKKGRYKGEWRNGMPNGNGIKHTYKDDTYIYGNFVDGLAEGHCKQTFEQTWEKMEPYYEGEFKRNEYQGYGEYHYGNGDYYKGDWKDSKYHGQGVEYSKRLNKTWVGEYCNDEKVEGNWVKGEI